MSISSTLFANSSFLSFLEVDAFRINLKVNISPNTLAVSANVKGVEALKWLWFFPARYWWTPWPNSCASVATSLVLPWKLTRIYGWTDATVDAAKAPGD